MISILTWNGSNITPEDDARLYERIAHSQSGYLDGCTFSVNSSGNIAISDGRLLVKGRVIQLTSVEITPEKSSTSATANGVVYIKIDKSNTTTPVQILTSLTKSTYTREDINGSGNVYELQLATYTANNISALSVSRTIEKCFDNIALFDVSNKLRIWIRPDGTIIKYNADGTTPCASWNSDGDLYIKDTNGTNRIMIDNEGHLYFYDSSNILREHHYPTGTELKDENGVTRVGISHEAGYSNIVLYGTNSKRRVQIDENSIKFYAADGTTVTREL